MATTKQAADIAAEYDAVIIVGVVEEGESFAPGWNYPFSRALDRDTEILKGRGYRRIGVFREPRLREVGRLLAGRNGTTRAVVLLGHGEFHGTVYSFRLNRKENLAADDLRAMAFADVVKPLLSRAARKRLADDPAVADAMARAASYGFEFVYAHSCQSLCDPQFRAALGGEYHGNPVKSFAAVAPLMVHNHHGLRVCAERFSEDPVAALQGALVKALRRLNQADAALTAPGYHAALREALAQVAALRRKGGNVRERVLAALRARFSVEFTGGDEHYDALSPDDVDRFLQEEGRARDEPAIPCGAPTRSSEDHHPCGRPVRGGGPCWQHGGYLLPPELRPRR